MRTGAVDKFVHLPVCVLVLCNSCFSYSFQNELLNGFFFGCAWISDSDSGVALEFEQLSMEAHRSFKGRKRFDWV